MCGRYYLLTSTPEMRARLGIDCDFPTSYNICPGRSAPILLLADGRRRLSLAHWGLIPSWAKDRSIAQRTVNGRAESIEEKAAFRDAFRHRHCVVPADGFFEWQRTAGGKQPLRINLADGQPIFFAGLWEKWWDARKRCALLSYTIITTAANRDLAAIHHRMPVILAETDLEAWLHGGSRSIELLRPAPAGSLRLTAVSQHVNDPRNNDPGCIAPLPA